MANSEATFKKSLVEELRKTGYHVHCTRDFGSGVPDLYIRGRESIWIELKFAIGPVKATELKVKLSPLQRKFIRDEQKAGGYAGWILCVKGWDPFKLAGKKLTWLLFTGADANVESVCIDEYRWPRGRGEEWSSGLLLDSIIDAHHGFVLKKV